MKTLAPATRKLAGAAAATGVGLLAAVLAGAGLAASPAKQVLRSVDTRLCEFPLETTIVTEPGDEAPVTRSAFTFSGPTTVTLRNVDTGLRTVLSSTGSWDVDTRTGKISWRGERIWFWSTDAHVPFLRTLGNGSFDARSVLAPGTSRARVLDPCVLVATRPSSQRPPMLAPPTEPATTKAPWGLPAYPLSQIAYAGLVPVLGRVVRHQHAHLDVIVDGRRIVVPGGIGLVEPVDRGTCPQGARSSGDCATGHGYFAEVANSPLHTHAPSGLIHIESDRRRAFTLGEFFDEWGVRLSARCVGGYCTGAGKELRVFEDGRRVAGDPRRIVLDNGQELAVVFGARGAFGSVPARYPGRWPGDGCGGPGERSCVR